MTRNVKVGLGIASATAFAMFVGYRSTKKTVLRRCRKKVVKSCKTVPLLSDEFCTNTAEEICQA